MIERTPKALSETEHGNSTIMPEVTLERTSSSAAICCECLVLCGEIITEEFDLNG